MCWQLAEERTRTSSISLITFLPFIAVSPAEGSYQFVGSPARRVSLGKPTSTAKVNSELLTRCRSSPPSVVAETMAAHPTDESVVRLRFKVNTAAASTGQTANRLRGWGRGCHDGDRLLNTMAAAQHQSHGQNGATSTEDFHTSSYSVNRQFSNVRPTHEAHPLWSTPRKYHWLSRESIDETQAAPSPPLCAPTPAARAKAADAHPIYVRQQPLAQAPSTSSGG
jgi:hypothetical protein